MPPQTILITGASGFLGWNLAQHFHRRGYDVVGTRHSRKPDHAVTRQCVQFDLEEDDAERLLAAAAPDVVVHCAALSSRKECDADPARARRINVDATARLAEAAAEREAAFVFISSDLVFDGSAAPYGEDDPPSPASVYGETKAEAEERVRTLHPRHHILRCALLYGIDAWRHPGGFLAWNVGGPRRGHPVRLYTNQYRMPLYVADVGGAIEALFDQHAAGTAYDHRSVHGAVSGGPAHGGPAHGGNTSGRSVPSGTWHLAGPDRLTRHDLGLRIAAHFDLPAELMQPVTLERDARFGPVDDTSLRTDRIIAAAGIAFTSLDSGLAETSQLCI